MGRLQSIGERPADRDVETAMDQAGWRGRNMVQVDSEVPEKVACGAAQLSVGVEAGIESSIHSIRSLREEHSLEEDWGFFIIDARNAFNEEDRTDMLWAVRHELPSGAQFTFNCYRHWVHTGGKGHGRWVRPLLAQQGGRDPGGSPHDYCIWHQGPLPH